MCLQTPPFGTPKKWPLYNGGCSLEVFQSKLLLKLVWLDLGWPLLTGRHCSEVVASTFLTVYLTFPRISLFFKRILCKPLIPESIRYLLSLLSPEALPLWPCTVRQPRSSCKCLQSKIRRRSTRPTF